MYRVFVAIVALFIVTVRAAPLPQLAGEGDACNSIFSSTDNGIGYAVENAEENTAKLIQNPAGAIPGGTIPGPKIPGARRQLAGEGAACSSILSSTDNGVGYGIENAEENTAKLISSIPHGVKQRRQLDKIANGAGALGDALGVGATTAPVVALADTIDGQTTSDGATLGAQIGADEETTLVTVGSLVP